ncbi:MAG: hypothetical protein Q8R83_04270 [Legionellaceae bacterium]|nr:hypothetical protein [Legionellaceae bacterium]
MKKQQQLLINRPGQPTKLNKVIAAEVVENVRHQLSISNAARLAGQPSSTVRTWIKRGITDAENGLYNDFVEFALDVGKARAEKVAEFINIIASGQDNWRAFAWLLEKCCPEDFGRDNELYRQLLNDYKLLAQSLIDQNKGVKHGGFITNTRDHSRISI